MKKILSILMAAAFVFMLALPCFAAADPNTLYNYNGMVLPDISPYVDTNQYNVAIVETTDGNIYLLYHESRFRFAKPTYGSKVFLTTTTGSSRIYRGIYSHDNETWGTFAQVDMSDDSKDILLNEVVSFWSNHDVVNSANGGVTVFYAKDYFKQYCDGSTCEWDDVNLDGECDTCGAMLYNFRYSSMFDYAMTKVAEVMDLKVIPETDLHWFITEYDDGWYLYVSDSAFLYSKNGDNLHSNGEVYRTKLSTADNGNFAYNGWVTLSTTSNLTYETPLYTSHDIDGFFPLTLPQISLDLQKQEIPLLTEKVARVMMILTVSSVSCLALVIVLHLFGKRSLLFLRR